MSVTSSFSEEYQAAAVALFEAGWQHELWQKLLTAAAATQSMSRKANCLDNTRNGLSPVQSRTQALAA